MKFLVISDLHAKNDILDKMDAQFKEADAVLFAGDFAECFKPETGADALHNLCLKHDTIFSVLGNCDSPDFVEILEEKDVSVQRSLVFHDGLAFAGSGGATIFTGKTEFEREEDDILSDFDIVLNACNESGDKSLWNKVILISHNPPKNTICDAVNPELHVGSQKFADFILENQPLAVITGHVHEGKGVEKIGNTTVINPGALMEGNYAWLEVKKSGDSWTVVSASLESVRLN